MGNSRSNNQPRDFAIAFSSFYKAAYAQDVLRGKGINSVLGKLPTRIAKACSTGLYVNKEDISRVKAVLDNNDISTKGIFEINGD